MVKPPFVALGSFHVRKWQKRAAARSEEMPRHSATLEIFRVANCRPAADSESPHTILQVVVIPAEMHLAVLLAIRFTVRHFRTVPLCALGIRLGLRVWSHELGSGRCRTPNPQASGLFEAALTQLPMRFFPLWSALHAGQFLHLCAGLSWVLTYGSVLDPLCAIELPPNLTPTSLNLGLNLPGLSSACP